MASGPNGSREDQKVKAAAIADLVAGMTYVQVAKKYGLGVRCVERWWAQLTKKGKKPGTNTRVLNAYHRALEKFALAALDMLTAQAELLSSPDYIRNKETAEIVTHTKFIHDRLVRHIELERALQQSSSDAVAQPALEQGAIEPEIVEEVD